LKIRLYVVPGSHPSRAVELMLQRKGLAYKRTDLPPIVSRFVVPRVLRFPADRVPAMKVDGRKVQGTEAISRELDELQPDPPLFPADPALRSRIEEIQQSDHYFQDIPRKVIWWALKRRKKDQASFLKGYRLGLPAGLAVATSPPLIRMGMRLNGSTDEVVRGQIAVLPAALDKIEGWMTEGLIDCEQPNAADYQLATGIRLLMSFDDFEPAIEGRPAAELARRYAPDPPGRIGPVFPDEWLAPIRGDRAAAAA
jgi:glutathione S-transferase